MSDLSEDDFSEENLKDLPGESFTDSPLGKTLERKLIKEEVEHG